MPHSARRPSESGYYHAVPKGLADQILFEDDSDRRLYVRLLGEAKEETGIRLHAYCLMSNHSHLVIEDPEGRISDTLKYVHERFAMHLAYKTGRSGGIFRKPYWREPIQTDGHLLCAVRYTHANPAVAGICKAAAYEWSSAKDYLGRNGIADTSMVLDMCDGLQGFIRFSQAKNGTFLPFPGSKLRNHNSDDEALIIAKAILGFEPHRIVGMNSAIRDSYIQLLGKRGFGRNLIMRMTGVGRRVVERCLA